MVQKAKNIHTYIDTYIHTFIVMLQSRQAGLEQYKNVIKKNVGYRLQKA